MEQSRQQLTYREALTKSMELCSQTEKCRFDMELKCRDWLLSSEETSRLTDYLQHEKFIDHQRYANSFVNDKFKFNKWGKIKLVYALRQKQLEERFIQEALSCLPEDAYLKVLLDLLSAKAKTLTKLDDFTRKGKMVAFAQSRGFEVDETLRVLERMGK